MELIRKILLLGSNNEMERWRRRRLMLANYLTFQSGVFAFGFLAYYLISDNLATLAETVLYIFSWFGYYFFMARGHYHIARHLIILAGAVLLTWSIVSIGPQSNLQLLLLANLPYPVLYFGLKEWRHSVPEVLLILGFLGTLIGTDFLPGLRNSNIDMDLVAHGSFTSYVAMFTLVFLFVTQMVEHYLSTKDEERLVASLKRENDQVRLLQQMATVANSSVKMEQALKRALDLIRVYGQFSCGRSIYIELEDTGIKIRPSRQWSVAPSVPIGDLRIQELSKEPELTSDHILKSVSHHEPLWLTRSSVGALKVRAFDVPQIKTVFVFPVLARGEVVAAMEFMSTEELPQDDHLINMARTFGDQLGRIEERLRYQARLDRSHEQMLVSARMAALGEMAGGIAHEINNPLAIIQAHTSRISRSKGRDDEWERIEDSATKINETIARIAKIIQGLKSMVWQSADEPFSKTSVLDLVMESVEIAMARYWAKGIELNIDPVSADLFIECRSTQILQVIVNLLNNAYDAVSESANRWVYLEVNDLGREIEIAVNDSGEGVPKHIRQEIMAPFYTTKPRGKGTGLGLAISHRIAESHNGRLFLNDTSVQTRFSLRLPKKQTGRNFMPSANSESEVSRDF
jgi:signal transduction histidine kinase